MGVRLSPRAPYRFMLNIPVVLGSVRTGRKSYFPAQFLVEKIQSLGHTSELVDFKTLPLPFFNSELMPVALKGKYPDANVQKWSEVALKADALVLVLSEYNHSFSAVIKNALDWLYKEFEKKPFGLVGVSEGMFGGVRAIEHMRPVIENFGAMALREVVTFGKIESVFDAQGQLLDPGYQKRADNFLASVVLHAEAFKAIRPKLV